MSETYLIAGLGNPGSRYAATRHNVGYKVAERIAERLNLSFRAGKGEYLISSSGPRPSGKSDGKESREGMARILLLKPLSFMNNSGLAVRHAVDYYRIELSQVLVIFDDYQLPLGKLRLRPGGSDGGHNGMASVIHYLGTQEVPRLRIGISDEFAKGDMAHYVLSPFSEEEREKLPAIFDRAADAAMSFVDEGIQHTMNRFNA
jgi:PTH1 family peptidyl-tRNA hydrolase